MPCYIRLMPLVAGFSDLMKDLALHYPGTEPAAEDLRLALIVIIRKYKLHPFVVIYLVARLTAVCIHLTQKKRVNKYLCSEVIIHAPTEINENIGVLRL